MTLYLKDKINLNELNERNEGRTLKVEVSVENIVFLHTSLKDTNPNLKLCNIYSL